MALLHIQMESRALHMPVPLDVILPQTAPSCPLQRPLKALYLLHGSSENQSAWLLKSNIYRYVQDLPLAVILPAGNNSMYVNTCAGQDYTDFLSWELPTVCEDWFPISRDREDRYICGSSMGGYGAFHAAMTYPEQFSRAISLSGAVDASSIYHDDDDLSGQAVNLLGPEGELPGGPNDLMALADKLADRPLEEIPRFLSLCGNQDYLLEDNLIFNEYMERCGLPLEFETWDGSHSWDFWDEAICRVLEWLDIRDRI
ncbi:MAG: esterase family protein [Oscillospiraceae bacterium]|nr:esterase family protein [Oscillospiraceae bacterium]